MSLTLYSPKSFISAGFKVEVVAEVLGLKLETVRVPSSEWKSAEHLKRHPLGKVPVLETPEGFLYESLAIVRYLARKAGKLYGNTPAETAQIDQWLEFNNTQLQAYIAATIYIIFGYVQSTPEKYEESKKGLLEVLKIVDAHLANNQHLAKEFSVADIVLAAQLRYPFTLILDETARNQIPNLTKWFVSTIGEETLVKIYGKTHLCQKEFIPDFEVFKRREDAKKEQAKKEQEAKKAEEAKIKEQQARIAQAEALMAAEKKKKNPLDDLPKSNFVLDDFKRDFVNAEDRAEAYKRFWAAFDPEGWSLWRSDYELYEGEGKVGYLTCNLKNGFVRNLEHFRKYAFGVLGVYGEEGDLNITGTWLWRGTEIPQEWIDHNAYDYFKFKRLDHNNEADRKLIEESWTNVEEGSYEGKPVFEAKWFK